MNKIYLGREKDIKAKRGIFICDKIPKKKNRNSRIFEIGKNHFNPLRGINEIQAADIATALYTTTPGGDSTMTIRNGRIALPYLLMQAKRLDEVKGNEEVELLMKRVLFFPLVRETFCSDANDFHFDELAMTYVPLDRAQIGDDTALIIGLILMAVYPYHITVEDFGFYGRPSHIRLFRQNRITVGLNYLDEIEDKKLRQALLSIPDKVIKSVLYDDAVELAKHICKFPPHTDGYDTYIKGCMQ